MSTDQLGRPRSATRRMASHLVVGLAMAALGLSTLAPAAGAATPAGGAATPAAGRHAASAHPPRVADPRPRNRHAPEAPPVPTRKHRGPLVTYRVRIPRVAPGPDITNIAHTFTVNNLGDTHATAAALLSHQCKDAGNKCTLRAAIEASNADPGNTYLVHVPDGTITLLLANGELEVTNSILIDGNGATHTHIDATGCACRIFNIHQVTATPVVQVTDLSIRHGSSTDGGGMYVNNAAVSLDGVRIANNTSSGDGGGIYNATQQSLLWISNSTISANTAVDDGGGIYYNYGQSVISNSLIGGTSAPGGNTAAFGGGIFNNNANLSIYDSHIDYNSVAGTGPYGGGIANCCYELVMQGGTISHNKAVGSVAAIGGGLYLETSTQLIGVRVNDNLVRGGVGFGGGIYGSADFQLDRVRVDNNRIVATTTGTNNFGGGVSAVGQLQMAGGTISGNRILTGGASTGLHGYGGGLYEDEAAFLDGVTIAGNQIIGWTGAPNTYSCGGGGVYEEISLHLRNVVLKDNLVFCYSAYGGGAGLYGDDGASHHHLTVTNNVAKGYNFAEGGAIDADTPLGITNSTFSNNRTRTIRTTGSSGVYGGAIYSARSLTLESVAIKDQVNTSDAASGSYVYYGALYVGGVANLTNVSIKNTSNNSLGAGGYVYSGAAQFSGPAQLGNVTIDHIANTAGSSGYIYYGAMYFGDAAALMDVSIGHTTNTVSGPSTYIYSGAIEFNDTARLQRVRITDTVSTAPGASSYIYGGALYIRGHTTIVNLDLLRTTATVGANGGGSSYIYGGAIYAELFLSDQLVIERSTIADTTARAYGATSYVYGGGMYVYSNSDQYGLLLTNSTLARNRAIANGVGAAYGGFGGGMYADSIAVLTNSTVDGNRASKQGGGVYVADHLASFRNTIVADSTAGSNCYSAGGPTYLLSAGRNLTTDLSCGFHAAGDRKVANTKLGALGAHGGFTKTIPLLAGSPAINAGGKAGCPPIDQRGHKRPHNGPCDIGAYER